MRSRRPKRVGDPALVKWLGLNAELRDCTEARCEELLRLEKAGRRRRQFLLRIHSRLNKVRADRERDEIKGG